MKYNSYPYFVVLLMIIGSFLLGAHSLNARMTNIGDSYESTCKLLLNTNQFSQTFGAFRHALEERQFSNALRLATQIRPFLHRGGLDRSEGIRNAGDNAFARETETPQIYESLNENGLLGLLWFVIKKIPNNEEQMDLPSFRVTEPAPGEKLERTLRVKVAQSAILTLVKLNSQSPNDRLVVDNIAKFITDDFTSGVFSETEILSIFSLCSHNSVVNTLNDFPCTASNANEESILRKFLSLTSSKFDKDEFLSSFGPNLQGILTLLSNHTTGN